MTKIIADMIEDVSVANLTEDQLLVFNELANDAKYYALYRMERAADNLAKYEKEQYLKLIDKLEREYYKRKGWSYKGEPVATPTTAKCSKCGFDHDEGVECIV